MYKVNKAVCLILAFVFSLSLFAGCGTANKAADASVPGSTASVSSTEPESSKPALEPVELSWYVVGKPQKDTALVEDAVADYLKDTLNCRVKINYFDWGAYQDKMNVMIATGDTFDLCFTANWMVNFIQNAGKGSWYDITTLVDQYAPKVKEKYAKYLDACKVNGKLYGIPYNMSGFGAQGAAFVRRDLLDKYKVDIGSLKTYEDLEPFFDQVVANEKGVTPICMVDGTSGLFNYWFDQPDVSIPTLGVKYDDQTCTVVNCDDDPLSVKDRELLRKWYLKGYIRKDAASIKDNNAEMKSKKYACTIGGYVPGWLENYEINWGLDCEAIVLGSKPLLNTTSITQSCTAVSSTSKNPERAVMLLEQTNTDPKLLNLMGFGIEGQHYVITDDSDPVIKIFKMPDGVTAETSGYKTNTEWMFGDPWMLMSDVPNRKELVEAQKKATDNCVVSPINGFTFDNAPVKTQVAQLTAIYNEYKNVWGMGSMDLAKFPEYQDRLKKAGLEDVQKEMQKQVDAWKANKK
jgi:putative aldouronate transport system substrate-binding protein